MTADRPAAMIREFHETFDLVIRDEPDALPVTVGEIELRKSLHREEFKELHAAMDAADVVEVADALADLVYVIYGTALHYGVPLDAVIAEVHRSNMTKLTTDGEVLRREDGKVLKPETFEPPEIARVLAGETEAPPREGAVEIATVVAFLRANYGTGFAEDFERRFDV